MKAGQSPNTRLWNTGEKIRLTSNPKAPTASFCLQGRTQEPFLPLTSSYFFVNFAYIFSSNFIKPTSHTIKFILLKYALQCFLVQLKLLINYHSLIPEHFYLLKKKPTLSSSHFPFPSSPTSSS